ncbi:MAG: pseudouridine-5'-phosphate glycosidase [Pseudomonadota bacterium]
MSKRIVLSQAVAAALGAGEPVVALESTIITHGLPRPRNLETAFAVEAQIRDAGATPATIAVFDGAIHVGLDEEALATLAATEHAQKLSRADLAAAIITNATGSTTVAATMIAAHLAGISVFATGGIGGVHRGAERSFDISADLQELAKTPLTVVAAGAKAILDLPKTLEVLETLGVPVIGFRTDEFPAFWSRTSGLPAPLRMDSADDIARCHLLRQEMGFSGGQLVANPIPTHAEIPAAQLQPVIQEAQRDAEREGVAGKPVTPFLLDRVLERTAGASLEANVALIKENARLAAEIAHALCVH